MILKQEVLALDDYGYGIWYLDSMDHLERYIDKKVEFTAMFKPEEFPKIILSPGVWQ